jgi:hypothetical protein
MDFKNVRPSTNFEDRTGWTEEQRKIQAILTLLNPAVAAANTYDWLQANGFAPIHQQVDFRKKR